MFTPVDLAAWPRRAHYAHYLEIDCSYSLTAEIDVTNLAGEKFYPAMLWLITSAVNALPAFRMDRTAAGLGVYDRMHPSYTIFHPENETFSAIWTPFHENYADFRAAYDADQAAFGKVQGFVTKPDRPDNSFDVSMLPWVPFTGFDLHVRPKTPWLRPIFTIGRRTERQGRAVVPVAAQVHHAVCDGYHVGQFFEQLSARAHDFKNQTNR